MKKTIVIIGLLTVSLWAEKCEYLPYNENYTRETVYEHIVKIIADDEFGCELDTRDIEAYDKGIFFTAQLDHIVNSGHRVIKLFKNQHAYDENNEESTIIDIWRRFGWETDKIRDIVYLKEERSLFVLAGFKSYFEVNLEDGSSPRWKDGFVVNNVDIVNYSLVVYKFFDDFALRIKLMHKEKYFDGQDKEGFTSEDEKFHKFKYKTHNKFLEKVKSFKVSDALILNSLENFLKPSYTEESGSLLTLEKSSFDVDVLKAILNEINIEKKTLSTYNNIAYYLQKAGSNKEAVYLLEKILKKYPNRTVAYYNLGDAYWALGDKKKARKAYTTYTEQMCDAGKQKRIPKVVIDRVSSK